MRTIEANATITVEQTLIVPLPLHLPPGQHRVVVVIGEKLISRRKRSPLKFSAYPVGQVSEAITFRREDLYGDQ